MSNKSNGAFENGVDVVMKNAKVEKSSGLKTSETSGKNYIQFKAVAPSNPKEPDKNLVKFTAVAFGKTAEIIAGKESGTFTFKGSIRPNSWKKDGQLIVSNQLIVNTAELAKGAPSAPVEIADDDVNDDIPF